MHEIKTINQFSENKCKLNSSFISQHCVFIGGKSKDFKLYINLEIVLAIFCLLCL